MKSCNKCRSYTKTAKYCNTHAIEISTTTNAQNCGDYRPKSPERSARRKRCNKCRHFFLDTMLYKCIKRNKGRMPYTALMACTKFEKKPD